MNRVLSLALLGSLALPPAAFAQEPMSPLAAAMTTTLQRYARNMPGAAELMPEEKFGFKPSPEQLSFGEILAHEAQSNEALCAAIGGGTGPAADAPGPTAPKADLVARLKKSFESCGAVVGALKDAALGDSVTVGGTRKMTRARAVIVLAQDWADHYSQAAAYLRANGILPPSAQPRPRP